MIFIYNKLRPVGFDINADHDPNVVNNYIGTLGIESTKISSTYADRNKLILYCAQNYLYQDIRNINPDHIKTGLKTFITNVVIKPYYILRVTLPAMSITIFYAKSIKFTLSNMDDTPIYTPNDPWCAINIMSKEVKEALQFDEQNIKPSKKSMVEKVINFINGNILLDWHK